GINKAMEHVISDINTTKDNSPRIVLLVHKKQELYKKIQNSNRSSQYLLYGLDKDNDIYDVDDLNLYYTKLRQLFHEYQYNTSEICKLDLKNRKILNLRFHQQLFIDKTINAISKNTY